MILSGFVPLLPMPQAEVQAASFIEIKRVPDLLGFKQGDRMRTDGLATGVMRFTALNHQLIDMNQEIKLNGFARKALEQVMGKKISSKTNDVKFRFTIKQVGNGFAYSLYDQGNRQLLLTGPVKIKIASGNNGSNQQLSFEAELVSMRLTLNKAAKVTGKANFAVIGIPVPGSMGIYKL